MRWPGGYSASSSPREERPARSQIALEAALSTRGLATSSARSPCSAASRSSRRSASLAYPCPWGGGRRGPPRAWAGVVGPLAHPPADDPHRGVGVGRDAEHPRLPLAHQ